MISIRIGFNGDLFRRMLDGGGRTLNVSFILRHPRTNDAYKKRWGNGEGKSRKKKAVETGMVCAESRRSDR